MADQQDQGAVAPAIAIGQVAPPPIPTEQHDDGAVTEVARAEAELQQEVAKMLAAQPLVITLAKKSKQFTSKETLLYTIFQQLKPLRDEDKKGAELKMANSEVPPEMWRYEGREAFTGC